MKSEPLLTIGIPVYNGEAYLRDALCSILTQSFADFVVVISDNASEDSTSEIAKGFAAKDPRVTYRRNAENIGAVDNFRSLTKNVATPYFMWFASDDVMGQGYLEYCISTLEEHPQYGMAFAGVDNIDSRGRSIRSYPHLATLAGEANWRTVYRFLVSPEIQGKANLIYSVYRTAILEKAFEQGEIAASWGGDMAFVLSALAQGGVSMCPEVLFHKRWVRPGDDAESPSPVEVNADLLHQSCPVEFFDEYEKSMVAAVKGTRFHWLARYVMRLRRLRLERLDLIYRGQPVNKSAWATNLSFVRCVVMACFYSLRRS